MPLFECKKIERLRCAPPLGLFVWRKASPQAALPGRNRLLHLASHPPLLSPSLLNNPVTAAEHYREFLIYHLPKLRLLDFKKVTGKVCRRRRWLAARCSCAPFAESASRPASFFCPQEREIATQLFSGPAGDAILRDIVKHSKQCVEGTMRHDATAQPFLLALSPFALSFS